MIKKTLLVAEATLTQAAERQAKLGC